MERTLSTTEVIRTLYIAASESRQAQEPKEGLDFYFALANIHLNSLMSLATSCEISAESDNLMPEIKSLMKRFSESLHLIAYGLDDAIGQIADDNNYVGWSPIYEFEEELKESYKEHKEQFGTKTTPV